MFWYLLLMLFSPLYLMFGLIFRSERARLVVALYQQVLVLQRQLGKQPSLVKVVNDDLPEYLIHDRDDKYPGYADSLLEEVGTEVIRLPVRSPDRNGYAERCIRSLRLECLDRIIVLNEVHLRWVLGECVRYYNERRPHQSLQHLPPQAPDAYPCEGSIVARPVLGGLIHDDCRLAA